MPGAESADGYGPLIPVEVASVGTPALTDAEVVQLQIRVIALENLVIAVLANAPHAAHADAEGLASNMLPRPGFTQHRSTLHAAHQMRHLLERALQTAGGKNEVVPE